MEISGITYTLDNHRGTAVVYDFCESRAGKHAGEFLRGWGSTLLVDDYAGYKQLMGEKEAVGRPGADCWAVADQQGTHSLRFLPALNISEDEIEQLVAALTLALAATCILSF